MEEKESYTPAEVAEIVEAYSCIYCSSAGERMERLRQYEKFVPENAQNLISRLRDVEYFFSNKSPEQKKEILGNLEEWTTGSEQFREFIEALLI
ncbi:Uncharacterised protein [uncultured archaeon]|nr:Uncharacterised protein [uncultured archaeon]